MWSDVAKKLLTVTAAASTYVIAGHLTNKFIKYMDQPVTPPKSSEDTSSVNAEEVKSSTEDLSVDSFFADPIKAVAKKVTKKKPEPEPVKATLDIRAALSSAKDKAKKAFKEGIDNE